MQTSTHTLTHRELSTVLAALRYWQRKALGRECDEQDIATDGGSIKPLHDADIDELCERLNAGPAPLAPQEPELIERATHAALDAGCALIQEHLGVLTGDFAGMYFTGEPFDKVRAVLDDYFEAELTDASRSAG